MAATGQRQQQKSPQRADGHEDIAFADADAAGSDWPVAFLRVQPICCRILDVIEAIDTAGNQAKRDKYNNRLHEHLSIQQVVAEENRCKDKEILYPLQGAEQIEVFPELHFLFNLLQNYNKNFTLPNIPGFFAHLSDTSHRATKKANRLSFQTINSRSFSKTLINSNI